MKRLKRPQNNTTVYWDDTYGDPQKAFEYKAASHRFTQALKYVKDGDKFMDLGCGVAVPGRALRREKNCEIWGVDISQVAIDQNKKDDPQGHYFQGYVGALSDLPHEYFDVVFSGETLEHLDYPEDLFTDAYRMLKKGGMFIVTTPLENNIDSEEHLWSFTKDDITMLYEKSGFSDVSFDSLPDMEDLLVIFAKGMK